MSPFMLAGPPATPDPPPPPVDVAEYGRLVAFASEIRALVAVGTPTPTKTRVREALARLDTTS